MEATKGSAMEQRTKVGEFPLGRDKKGERGDGGPGLKEEEEGVGGEAEEEEDRRCPRCGFEDIRGLIEFTSSPDRPT